MNPAKTAAVVLGALVLQLSLFSRFSYEGARPDLMVLVAVAAGVVAGREQGAGVGFAAGLAIDLFLATPLGLSALVYTVIGYAAGGAGSTVVRTSRWITPLLVGGVSGAAMVAYALVGAVLGEPTLEGPPLTAIVVVVAGLNAVLATPAVRAMRWARAEHADPGRRPYFAR